MTEQFETPAEVLAEFKRVEGECPLHERFPAMTIYGLLKLTAAQYPDRPASSFQMFSEPGSKAQTLSWREMLEQVQDDGRGVVDFSEFLKLMAQQLNQGETEEDMREAFNMFDKVLRSGSI